MSERAALGRRGEDAAAAYLESLGFRIVSRNVRGPGGEIDIVARDGATLVFIEVKTRRSDRFGRALDAVDRRKRRRIRATAEDFLQFYPSQAKIRFDVLAIDGDALVLHRGAFA